MTCWIWSLVSLSSGVPALSPKPRKSIVRTLRPEVAKRWARSSQTLRCQLHWWRRSTPGPGLEAAKKVALRRVPSGEVRSTMRGAGVCWAGVERAKTPKRMARMAAGRRRCMGTSRVHSLQFTVHSARVGRGRGLSAIRYQRAGSRIKIMRSSRERLVARSAEDAEIRREEERDGNTEFPEVRTQRAQRRE